MKNKYFNFFAILILIIISISIFASSPPGSATFTQKIFSPFGTLLKNVSQDVKYNSETDFMSKITTNYIEVNSNIPGVGISHGTNNDENGIDTYCQFGGLYKMQTKYNGSVGGTADINSTLYYCKNTRDLINKIKIPFSWKSNNLILYCNDGSRIAYEELSMDFITSLASYYKICILKNLDLKDNNSLIYGFEVGNSKYETDPKNFYNISATDKGKHDIVGSLEYDSFVQNVSSTGIGEVYFNVDWTQHTEVYSGKDSCFAAGTLVLMKDGSNKKIEDVNVGDKVASVNGYNTIISFDRPFLTYEKDQRLISINGGDYFITDNHPIMTTNGWKAQYPTSAETEAWDILHNNISKLEVGDRIILANKSTLLVKTIEIKIKEKKSQKLYNFVLDGDHTYYANNMLVMGFVPDKAGRFLIENEH